jgi:uncharacterized membrane protein
MTVLLAGLLIFFLIHSVSIVAPSWRDRTAASIGAGPWQGLYSLISIVGFVLILWGYGQARATPVVLYTPPPALKHLAAVLMIPVFPLLLSAYLPGRIKTALKHPMLVSIKLWAFAHLLANGMLADVLLFGSFLVWAVADRISMKRRIQRPVPGAPPGRYNDIIAVVGGLVLYVAFVSGLHAWLFGVRPIS